jgi:acetyl esterase/lipase
MHGGGFVTGSLETDDCLCRLLATEVGVCILNIEYRLTSEYQFPASFEDRWDVLKWCATQAAAKRLKADLKRVF